MICFSGTQTLLRHHVTFSTASTQYCESDITDLEATELEQPHLVRPTYPLLHVSTPKSKRHDGPESPDNRSFMSSSSWTFDDDDRDQDYEPESSFHSESEDEDHKWYFITSYILCSHEYIKLDVSFNCGTIHCLPLTSVC